MRCRTFLPILVLFSSPITADISALTALSTTPTDVFAPTMATDVKTMIPRGKPGGVNDSNCPNGTTFVPHDMGGVLLGWGCHRKWMKHKQCCRKDEGRRYICSKGWQKNCKPPPPAAALVGEIEGTRTEEMNEGKDMDVEESEITAEQ